MPIDGFTIVAQVLNFLVLVWLLKRFLYKPVLDAIETRETGIREELASADAKRDQARKDGDEFRRKNEAFDRDREGLLAKAVEEADAKRQDMMDAARAEADRLARKRRDALQTDYVNLARELGRKARMEVFAVARKTLADLANSDLEKRVAMVFARRLRDMDEPTRETFAEAMDSSTDPAVVRSAFELDESGRDIVRAALNETFHAEIPVRFETSPDLVAGVEISSNGQKMSWSISEYLELLDKDVQAMLA